MSASISLVEGTGLFLNTDMAKTVTDDLHARTPELRDMEVEHIQERSPEDTGALIESEMGIAYTNAGEDLVLLYDDPDVQIATWNRVYAPYQEGGELGLETYTNGPHEMFGRVLTDDIADITAWGQQSLQGSMDSIATGGKVA